MILKKVWSDRYIINSWEVNTKHELRLDSLCWYLQETAWRHAEHLHFGYSDLNVENLAWVLTRLKIITNSYPQWGDEVTLETWPLHTSHRVYYRDFILYNSEKQIIIRATSTWIIINKITRKPAVFSKMPNSITWFPDKHAIEEKAGRLDPVNKADIKNEIEIKYSDLDVNQHLNNANYTKWIMDSFDKKTHEHNMLKEFTINYLDENLYGHKVILLKKKDQMMPQLYHFEGFNSESGKASFRAKVRWAG